MNKLPKRLVADAEEIIAKLRSLEPGERYVYHRGYLTDRGIAGLAEVAGVAQKLSTEKKVHLSQKRIPLPDSVKISKDTVGPGFEYIATGLKSAS